MLKWLGSGHLAADPIVEGKATLCRLNYRDHLGNKKIVGFACYGKCAENLAKHCRKGKYIVITEGEVCPFVKETSDGRKYNISLKALRIEYGPDNNYYGSLDVVGRTCGECKFKKENNCLDANDKHVVYTTPACNEFEEKEEVEEEE